MDGSVNGHIDQPNAKVEMVWYGGDDAVAEGIALFYNSDYGTAADSEASRGNRVEKPGGTLNSPNDFAGVAKGSYAARTGGQFIEIYAPGSRCVPVQLDTGETCTINTGTLKPAVTTGEWTDPAAETWGRGAALPRETGAAADLVIADLLEGALSDWGS